MIKVFYSKNNQKNNQISQYTQNIPNNKIQHPCICREQNKLNLIILFIFFSLFPYGKSQNFSKNYIQNGNFSLPHINVRTQYFNSQIPGWKCTWLCQIKNCELGRKGWLPQHLIDSDCIGQVIDLNSNSFNQVVSQSMELKSGKYLLHFNYYYPIYSANLKELQVSFNDNIIFHHKPLVSASFEVFHFQTVLSSNEGTNKLSFANLGSLADNVGFKINNVSLYQIYDRALQQFLDGFVYNGKTTNFLPGGRVVFRSFLSFMINFDRLELYIYHNRTYSYNSEQLLLSINDFLNSKSTLAMTFFQLIDQSTVQKVEAFTNSISFKTQYLSYSSFNPDYQKVGYFDSLNQDLLYFLPIILVVVVLLNFMFLVFFHSPFSILFRKFSLWAIVFVMVFDGNIQNLTFFTFAEFKSFFSLYPSHKVLNTAVLLLFFAILFTVFGLLLWGRYHYKSKVKYLMDEQASRQAALWGIMIDRGIVCVLFGVVHQMVITQPDIQLFLLIVLEILWSVKKVMWLWKGLNKEKMMVIASILSGFCRIFFQVTIFLYQNEPSLRFYINQNLHSNMIYILIGSAALQMVFGVANCLRGLLKFLCNQKGSKTANIFFDSTFAKSIPLRSNNAPLNFKNTCVQFEQLQRKELKFCLTIRRQNRLYGQKTNPQLKFKKGKTFVSKMVNLKKSFK